MTTDRRELLLYHARELIARILNYTFDGKQAFLADLKTQDAVLRNIEIIGQVVRDLGVDWLAEQEPSIPWRDIAGMRNVLAHAYLGIALEEIWTTIQQDLSPLDEALARIAAQHHFTPYQT